MAHPVKNLVPLIKALSTSAAAAFAASCAQRMAASYFAFAADSHSGSPETVMRGLDAAWEWAGSGLAKVPELDVLMRQCEALVPDSEEATSDYADIAQTAVSAVVYTLGFCATQRTSRVCLVSELSFESIHEWLEAARSPEAWDKSLHDLKGLPKARILQILADREREMNLDEESHPLWKAELDRQTQDLLLLRSIELPSFALLVAIKASSIKTPLLPIREKGADLG